MLLFLKFLGVASLATAMHAETKTFTSGPQQTALLELYTSEGCSSCPPAEAWLSRLKEDTELWTRVVPVAFHVTYWDNLGWKDNYASKRYTERQYEYAARWRSENVYTPCFVRNGREWKISQNATEAESKAGILRVTVSADACAVEYRPENGAGAEFQVTWVRLGGDIVSNVRAGENSGRHLTHDFVATELNVVPLNKGDDGVYRAVAEFSGKANGPYKALAVWVSKRNQLEALQATGGWLN